MTDKAAFSQVKMWMQWEMRSGKRMRDIFKLLEDREVFHRTLAEGVSRDC